MKYRATEKDGECEYNSHLNEFEEWSKQQEQKFQKWSSHQNIEFEKWSEKRGNR